MKKRIVGQLAAVVLVLAAAGCYYTPVGGGAKVPVTASVVMKQPAADLMSGVLVVTGPRMATISQTVDPLASSAPVSVPAGKDRTFTILINTFSATFQDETTVDLESTPLQQTVDLYPGLYATQIIVPDYANERIVQISDMEGAGWTAKKMADLGALGIFWTKDIDFDSDGRIYISNDYWTPTDVVVRIDALDDDTAEIVVGPDDVSTDVPAIAVDRVNGYLYYCDTGGASPTKLYRKTIDPLGSQEVFDPVNEELAISTLYVNGMAVDASGILYIANSSAAQIIKYDPEASAGSRVKAQSSIPQIIEPTDVIVKENGSGGESVYVTNRSAPDGYSILELNLNLGLVAHFGKQLQDGMEAPPPEPSGFYGPLGFVAPLNETFYVMDEYNPEGPVVDRIVAFDDMSGAGWTTYGGATGSGVGEFNFTF